MRIRLIYFVGLQALFLAQVKASEPESLRLFHGLNSSDNQKDKSLQLTDKRTTAQLSVSPVADTPETSDMPQIKLESGSYHYNGFISSVHGKYYFINGIQITELASIELVASNNAGRSLQLRTDNGDVFTIAIGETIFVVPVREKNQIRDTDDNAAL